MAGVMSPADARLLLGARLSRRVSAIVVIVGAINILAALGLDLRTVIAPVGPAYEVAFLPSFLLAFPLMGWSVLLMMALAGGTRRGLKSDVPRRVDVFGRLPTLVWRLLATAAVVGVVGALSGIPAIAGGQPTFVSATGQYTLASHGSVRLVTRAVYEQAVAGGTRVFLCWPILASCLALAVALNHWLGHHRSGGWTPSGTAAPAH